MWTHDDGTPLKFQDGDYVRIDVSRNPEYAYSLPFLSGYVRGYDISVSGTEKSVGYELFKMGHHPLFFVREDFLERVPEEVPHAFREGTCDICGK